MKAITLMFFFTMINAQAFDWQGHRGARGLYPENTIESMKEALKYPVTTLELDVVVSQDKQVVVSHEPWMSGEICLHPEGQPIKGEEINLYKMPYAQIVRFDCGSKNHPRFPQQTKAVVGKPLLSRLLTETEAELKKLGRQNTLYNVEIKSTVEDEKRGYQPEIKEFSDLVIKTMLAQLPHERFTIQSFDWRVLKYIHKKYPEIKLVALREESYSTQEVLKDLGFNPAVFSPYYKLLTRTDIEFFQQKGIKVIPWTVNTVEEMRSVRALGVDGIITDYPNLIEQVESKSCGEDHNLFEGKCVKVPTHAVPSEKNPGWDCKPGHVQKRDGCHKIKIPEHGELSADGKSWVCQQGFVRYRGSCKKR